MVRAAIEFLLALSIKLSELFENSKGRYKEKSMLKGVLVLSQVSALPVRRCKNGSEMIYVHWELCSYIYLTEFEDNVQ